MLILFLFSIFLNQSYRCAGEGFLNILLVYSNKELFSFDGQLHWFLSIWMFVFNFMDFWSESMISSLQLWIYYAISLNSLCWIYIANGQSSWKFYVCLKSVTVSLCWWQYKNIFWLYIIYTHVLYAYKLYTYYMHINYVSEINNDISIILMFQSLDICI